MYLYEISDSCPVPPSQGRVYRCNSESYRAFSGSALTRAGISILFRKKERPRKFRPHKGGYIIFPGLLIFCCLVPPSQGRVYRKPAQNVLFSFGSALTRAGISPFSFSLSFCPQFRPHKGGYITGEQTKDGKSYVPPSQGRVYRLFVSPT